jgi:7-cyano-7-deazaguanine synthase in queuosine biosynthesis
MLRNLFKSDIPVHVASNRVMRVSVVINDNVVVLSTGEFRIQFISSKSLDTTSKRVDFAVWAFLPIAMATGCNLEIIGKGTFTTARNAEKLSDIWSSWLPQSYAPVDVSFTEYAEPEEASSEKKELLLFSGGVDATHTLITKHWNNGPPDLLTVQGLEYSFEDDRLFADVSDKCLPFTQEYAAKRIYIKTDAYAAYKKVDGIVRRMTFVFVLAAASFLFRKEYQNVVISADYTLYQQFEAFPYASSIVTNLLYNSGDYRIVSFGDNITRTEKLIPISLVESALKSLTFCYDKTTQPENCGKCVKCIRTKYMFLAAIGRVPQECFINQGLEPGGKIKFSKHARPHRSFVFDTFYTAQRMGHLTMIPEIVTEDQRLRKKAR